MPKNGEKRRKPEKISGFSVGIFFVNTCWRCRPGMPSADTCTLRLKSELFDLRVGYVNRLSLRFAQRNRFKSKAYTAKRKNRGHHTGVLYLLEVQAGFEPADNGVADRGLTTWLLHQILACHSIIAKFFSFVKGFLTFWEFYFCARLLHYIILRVRS